MSASAPPIPFVRLGKSGLKVSRVILGCMSYGSSKWQDWVLDEAEGIKHIKAAWEAGINTFDTADSYSNGQSEVVLGKALKQLNIPREKFVVLTKVFFPFEQGGKGIQDPNDPKWGNGRGLNRKHIFEAIRGSLERLQLDYVDVLQCHRFDKETPIEETMQALHDVVKAGYARYIGMSSCYAYQFSQMQNYAIQNRLTPFISMQNFYNAIYREEEREMFPTLEHFGVGAINWSPLARGFLGRPAGEQTTRSQTDRNFKRFVGESDASNEINRRVEAIAKKRNLSMAQVGLAWSLSKPFITAPIIGSTNLDRLMELIDAVHVQLTPEEVAWIDEPYQPRSINAAIMGHS